MKRIKVVTSAVVFSVVMVMECVTAFAAPKYMKDGTVFDSEYYAMANPDVVKVFGTSEKSLWRHYRNWGRKENRSPYDPIAYQMLLAQAMQDAQAAPTVEAPQTEAVQNTEAEPLIQTPQAETTEPQIVGIEIQPVIPAVDLGNVDAVINTIGTEAMFDGYTIVEMHADNPDNLSEASEIWLDMFNSRGVGFRVVYGPKGNISHPEVNVPPCRLALCELKSDLYTVKKCTVANSVEELTALLISNK